MTENSKTPNLFVPGFAKSGTSHLCKVLGRSSEIFLPSEKEPHYFAGDLVPDNIRISRSSYLALYEKSKARYRLDGSVSYIYSDVAIKRIVDSCQSPRFIVLIRNPFDRMVSHYKFNVRNGVEKRSFPQALKNKEGLNKQWAYDYLEMSDYEPQIQRLLESLKDYSQVRLIDYDEYRDNPRNIIERIAEYLEVEIPVDDTVDERVNVSKEPKFKFVNDVMVVDASWKRAVKCAIPFSLRRKIKKYIHNKNISKNEIAYSQDAFTEGLCSKLNKDHLRFKSVYRELYI